MKITTSSEFLSLTELIKLHDSSLSVCPTYSHLNTLTGNPNDMLKAHSRRRLELNPDDLLKFFNTEKYTTNKVAFNQIHQPVSILMPQNMNKATDFSNMLKAQLMKVINHQYKNVAGVLFHFDETVPNVHILFYDYNSNDPTPSFQPHHSKPSQHKANSNEQKLNEQTKIQHKEAEASLKRFYEAQLALKLADDSDDEKKYKAQLRLRRLKQERMKTYNKAKENNTSKPKYNRKRRHHKKDLDGPDL